MKIGVDLRHIVAGSSGGIVPHLQGVLRLAFRLAPQDEFTVFTTCFNHDLLAPYPANARQVTLPVAGYYARLSALCSQEGIEVLFRGYPGEETGDFPAHRQVVLIPDLQHEQLPDFFDRDTLRRRRFAFNLALSSAGAVGTGSRTSLDTLRSHPWTKVEDLFIMSPALPEEDVAAELSPEENAQIPSRPFFYFPANLWPHKNHRRLLQAFDAFLQTSHADVELVLTGHPAGWEALRAEFPSLPVRHLGFTSRALVRALYERSLALLFFSLYEGFGMPLLEAFAAGTPVLCSNTASLPEVGGDAVLSCDPTDVQAIAALMGRILAEPGLRAELAARGRQRLGLFSWDRSARALLDAFRRVAARPAPGPDPSRPLVTIVTPSYNQAEFLRRTIDSVMNQTYPHIQYIVMDGGSSDGSREILESYGNRFQWISEKDQGQAHAINKGLAQARGEILAYLNSDDTLLPDAVENVVVYFASHPECDLVYGKAYYIDEDDTITGEYNTAPYTFDRLVRNNPICQPAAFWRKRAAGLVGPFDESFKTAMDHDYWMRLDRAGACIQYFPHSLASSRMYAENKTLSMREVVFAEVFRLSRQHAGYVSLSYYIGLWYYRAFLKGKGWPRFLRHIPRGFLVAARLHHIRDHGGLREAARQISSFTTHRAVLALKRRLPFLRGLGYAWARVFSLATPSGPVVGFFPDGNFAPIVQFHLAHRPASSPGYIAGSALRDCTLEISCAGRKLGTHLLRAGEPIRIDLPALPGSLVRLSFSRWTVQPGGGGTAFILHGTNLFSEDQAFR